MMGAVDAIHSVFQTGTTGTTGTTRTTSPLTTARYGSGVAFLKPDQVCPDPYPLHSSTPAPLAAGAMLGAAPPGPRALLSTRPSPPHSGQRPRAPVRGRGGCCGPPACWRCTGWGRSKAASHAQPWAHRAPAPAPPSEYCVRFIKTAREWAAMLRHVHGNGCVPYPRQVGDVRVYRSYRRPSEGLRCSFVMRCGRASEVKRSPTGSWRCRW